MDDEQDAVDASLTMPVERKKIDTHRRVAVEGLLRAQDSGADNTPLSILIERRDPGQKLPAKTKLELDGGGNEPR